MEVGAAGILHQAGHLMLDIHQLIREDGGLVRIGDGLGHDHIALLVGLVIEGIGVGWRAVSALHIRGSCCTGVVAKVGVCIFEVNGGAVVVNRVVIVGQAAHLQGGTRGHAHHEGAGHGDAQRLVLLVQCCVITAGRSADNLEIGVERFHHRRVLLTGGGVGAPRYSGETTGRIGNVVVGTLLGRREHRFLRDFSGIDIGEDKVLCKRNGVAGGHDQEFVWAGRKTVVFHRQFASVRGSLYGGHILQIVLADRPAVCGGAIDGREIVSAVIGAVCQLDGSAIGIMGVGVVLPHADGTLLRAAVVAVFFLHFPIHQLLADVIAIR